jgi:succinate dehydrogenase / fumarate reductase cytochrome b subunit
MGAVVLVGYMLIHVLGNLLIFLGPAWINGYGALLHATGPLLWAARVVIFVALVLHVVIAVALAVRARRARPEQYAHLSTQASTLAARTMLWTGLVLLLFAGYHVPQFTAGWCHTRASSPATTMRTSFGSFARRSSTPSTVLRSSRLDCTCTTARGACFARSEFRSRRAGRVVPA